MKFIFFMKNFILNFFFKFGCFFSNNLKRLFLFKKNEEIPKNQRHIDETIKIKKYEEKIKKKFLETYEDGFSKNMNENINEIFYSKKKLEEMMKDMDNIIEKEWKTKLLFENTPRGKVIMFYDAYKMGFSYYSDNSFIPYSLLNSVAMKYVITFFCRDFFVDENIFEPIIENEKKSPFINLYFKEEKKEKKRVIEKTPDFPFAKLKNYKLIVKNDIKNIDKENSNENNDKKMMNKTVNKFIYMGNINNFNPINKKIIQQNFSTKYEDLFSNINDTTNRLNELNKKIKTEEEIENEKKKNENTDEIINKNKISYKNYKIKHL